MLGYALELMEDNANIAEGLAFLCFSFKCLGLPSKTVGIFQLIYALSQPQLKDPFEILRLVREDHDFDDIRSHLSSLRSLSLKARK